MAFWREEDKLSIKIIQNEEVTEIERLKSMLEDNPNSLEVNLETAEYYLNNEMFLEAEPYLIKSIQIDDNQANIHNHLGVVYFHQGDLAKSEYHFKKALSIDLNMVESYFNLGMLYQSQERFKEALPYYNTVVTMEPDNAEIYNLMGQCAMCLGMIPEAKEFFGESFRLSPSTKNALDLSIILISQDRYSEAEELLDFLIKSTNSKQGEDADTESLNFTMGLVLKKQGKNIEAIKHFQNVVTINERNEQAYNYMGECCVELNMEVEAESFFAKATKLDPEYMPSIMNLGRLYFRQERFYNAILAIERFIEIKSGTPRLDDKDIEKPKDTDVEFAYEMLGKAYMHIGERERAISLWQDSLKVNPDQPKIISLLNNSPAKPYAKTTLSIDD
jgi:tetratricopeptide (TPR) repeat protein